MLEGTGHVPGLTLRSRYKGYFGNKKKGKLTEITELYRVLGRKRLLSQCWRIVDPTRKMILKWVFTSWENTTSAPKQFTKT